MLFGLGLAAFSLSIDHLDSLPAWPAPLLGRQTALSQILLGLGAFLVAFALYGWLRMKQGKPGWGEAVPGLCGSVVAQVRQGFRQPPALDEERKWLMPILAIGASLYAFFLSQPMRGDEAYTFLNYVNGSLWDMFRYNEPNNHVLHTLLVKLSVLLFGGEPTAIRLPAFLAGVASIALAFYLARAITRLPAAGILAAMATAVFPFLALYAANARGYTLLVALLLALALTSVHFAELPSPLKLFGLAFFSAASLLAIPSALLGLAGLFPWMLLLLFQARRGIRWIFFDFILPYGLLTAGLTFLFYLPVILVMGDANAILSNRFVTPFPFDLFWEKFPLSIPPAFEQMTRDIPFFLGWGGFALLIAAWGFAARKRDWPLIALLPILLAAGTLVVMMQRRLPYARSWIYLIPLTLVVIDYGFAHLMRYIPTLYQSAVKVVVLVGGIFFALSLASHNVIARYPDTSAFPEAPLAAQYLKPILTENDAIHVTDTANVPLHFYFWYYDMPGRGLPRKTETGRTFYIVKKSRYSIESLTDQPTQKLLDIGDLQIFELVK